MAELEQLNYCCGIHELYYVRDHDDPEDLLMSLDPMELRAHVIFSVTSRQTPKHRKGIALADYILRNNLGPVVSTAKGAKNPGHTGTIKAWLWTPNRRAVGKWQKRIRKSDPEKYGVTVYDPYGWNN